MGSAVGLAPSCMPVHRTDFLGAGAGSALRRLFSTHCVPNCIGTRAWRLYLVVRVREASLAVIWGGPLSVDIY